MFVVGVESRQDNDEYSQSADRPVTNPRGNLDEITHRDRDSIIIELHGSFTVQDVIKLGNTTVIVFFCFGGDVDHMEAGMMFLADEAVAPTTKTLNRFYT
jgi:hypothetical protein